MMTTKRVLRYMIECEHGIDNYVDDEPTAYDQPLGDYAPAGEFVTVRFYDDGGVAHDAKLWTGHKASTGTRQPPKRTKAHARGYIVDPRTNRAIGFSSTYELTCILFLMASSAVVEIEDQPPAVTYFDADGKKRKHIYDLRASLKNGLKIVYPIKPVDQLEKTKIKEVVERTKPHLDGFADKVVLLTDRTLTRDVAWNSKSIVHAHKVRDEADCQYMLDLVRDIRGEFSAYKVARTFKRFADGFNAILCLLYDGVLELVQPHRKLIDAPYVRVRQEEE
ncbi:hypothetical protein [Rhizobium leguminosarum]|uniref:hypothetical protein n=1 Tax=Rhizobium leguminosarum TaxID=384 RepID=UPI001031F90F|nr:hypothetical protein [Rhizobium leguminosarum]TBF40573.1 hypothetical protein ELG92_11160 [Rhizobium leguminosarum]